jgi:hypothetical protein
MGFLTGLASVNEKLDSRKGGDFEDRVKTVWAGLKNPGDASKVIPLQELDEGSPHYSEKNGTALFVLEHSNPDNFKKSAQCTADEGGCYGCEQGWYQKVVLYINVLMDVGTADERVAVLSKGTGKGSVGKELLNIAADEDFDNSISDKVFKFSREGKGTDTSYGFSPIKKHDRNVEDFTDQLFDLKQVPFTVQYEKQDAYYNDGQEKKVDAPKVPVSASSVDSEW